MMKRLLGVAPRSVLTGLQGIFSSDSLLVSFYAKNRRSCRVGFDCDYRENPCVLNLENGVSRGSVEKERDVISDATQCVAVAWQASVGGMNSSN